MRTPSLSAYLINVFTRGVGNRTPGRCLAMLAVLVLTVAPRPGQAEISQQQVLGAMEEVKPTIQQVAQQLWDLSEVSLLESESAALLKGILQQNGFTITSEGTANVPTAFVAEYGEGEPKLGIMLEYDALPGLGNAAVPKKQPREDGVTAGHGCGHNLIGAGALGAALAIKDLMQSQDITGTLRVYGGAAEETEGAKVFMARAGLFNDLDAMLHWHPSDVACVANVRMAAAQHLYIEFKGKAAHAGLYPWKGRSALDAVEILTHSVNMMREHVEPTARIHYIITEGGNATNVVPAKAALLLTYRDVDRLHVNAGVTWIKQMVEGAALCTQTEGIAIDYFGMHDTLPNTPLAERMQGHFQQVGLPEYTEAERQFALDLQQAAQLESTGISDEILPIPNEITRGGFSDIGDVSLQHPHHGAYRSHPAARRCVAFLARNGEPRHRGWRQRGDNGRGGTHADRHRFADRRRLSSAGSGRL